MTGSSCLQHGPTMCIVPLSRRSLMAWFTMYGLYLRAEQQRFSIPQPFLTLCPLKHALFSGSTGNCAQSSLEKDKLYTMSLIMSGRDGHICSALQSIE